MGSDKWTVCIITMSDSRATGSGKVDESGTIIREIVESAGYKVVDYQLIPDDFDKIKDHLLKACQQKINLVLTTGGTGLSPRDQTPEATRSVLDREVPGISEAMRYHSLQITPRAMLSRGVSGICQQSLIINLPGSPKAVRENLTYILPTLSHGLAVLLQKEKDCGTIL